MIVPMKRLTLIAHQADEARIMEALQRIGAVEIISSGEGEADQAALAAAEEQVQRFKATIELLYPYAEKSKMGPKPEFTKEELQGELGKAGEMCAHVEELDRALATARSDIEKHRTMIAALSPWRELDTPIENVRSSAAVRYFTGYAEGSEIEKLGDLGEAAVEVFGSGRDCALLIACRTQEAEHVQAALKAIAYAEFTFPKLTGTPAANIRRLEEAISALEQRETQLIGQLTEAAKDVALVRRASDAAAIARDLEAGKCALAATAETFMLDGWARSDETELIQTTLQGVTEAFYLDFRDPEEDEVPPSVVKNGKFASAFEAVNDLYSKPDPRGIDGTPLMAPFYFLFFGMMLSDSGYGIVLTLGSLFFLKWMKPTGMFRGIVRTLFYGGISTAICGVFIGTFFGMDWNTLLGTAPGTFPLLFDPMTEPMSMLFLCFGLGLFHMLFGVCINIWRKAKAKDWKAALFDNASWLMIIVGLIIFASPMLLNGVPKFVSTVGLVIAILGAALILVFAGRGKKVVSRAMSGAGKLYDITSYLSDTLSYARVFALGLSTGVIGQVFNTLGSMFNGAFQSGLVMQVIGIVLTAVLLCLLHLFSLAINTLGCFIHCARLQYVEFYGKFYDAGGRDFVPLGYRTRHVRVKQ